MYNVLGELQRGGQNSAWEGTAINSQESFQLHVVEFQFGLSQTWIYLLT